LGFDRQDRVHGISPPPAHRLVEATAQSACQAENLRFSGEGRFHRPRKREESLKKEQGAPIAYKASHRLHTIFVYKWCMKKGQGSPGL